MEISDLISFVDETRYVKYSLLLIPFILLIRYIFAVPKELRHIAQVPILPTIWSFARGEVEDARIKRLILPFAEKGEPAVVIWALGRWIIHLLDRKLVKDLSADIDTFPKEVPPDGMLLWRFVGFQNIILSNGKSWARHSRIVKEALNRNLPVEDFAMLARKLFKKMGSGGTLQWEDYTMRYTLDAVGKTALGYDFNAIAEPHNPFVNQYNHVMESIANPAYLLVPKLESWFPRKAVISGIDSLVALFQGLLDSKKQDPGNDMLTYMLEDKEMTDTEFRDNMVVFFIAGHDTTAGAMSSLSYYMAMKPEIQRKAREEVRAALANNPTGEPTLSELKEMPYLQACIRESLRINTPITYIVPRSAQRDVVMTSGDGKAVAIPKGSSIIINITAVHHNDGYWADAEDFRPERFMGMSDSKEKDFDTSQWLPFALGPRQCPARNFALHELRTLSSMLLNEWEWTIPQTSPHLSGIKNGFSPFALSLPKNLYLDFKPLKKSSVA